MQTFLPYPDFRESAASLDTGRLGKQRVEALQILRALVIPDYGWRSHPAVRMWMGHVPALTAYGLAMVDQWIEQGHDDSTRSKIQEFTPATPSREDPVMPPWLGDPAFHLAHRSNLIRKDPDFYLPVFDGVPQDLPYIWPEPADVQLPQAPSSGALWVFRASPDQRDDDQLVMRRSGPKRKSPKWQRQAQAFTTLMEPGTHVAVTYDSGETFRTGTVTGEVETLLDGALARTVAFDGERDRASFPQPALLQDPKTLFAVAVAG
ncbi:MSMEG_6728 family protein [Arthrobacter roseus]|uniref:MSMEG_6728 family protein n=1 Tax=Arthrobacter roseus TaxID=136274 RepID=UPI001962C087|nr:hypothetical protein [Arthrobacter roseus]